MTASETKPSTSLVSFCTRDITRPASLRSKKDMESLWMWLKASSLSCCITRKLTKTFRRLWK